MGLFLMVLGAVALVVILLVVGFIFLFWWKMRAIAKGMASATPSALSLKPEADAPWLTKAAVRRDLAALASCGYTCGQAYAIEGMPGVSLVSLHHAATGIYGCYYEHLAAGNWTDLCADFADGLELTICNAPQGHQLDTRPNTEKIFQPGVSAGELHAAMAARVAGHALKEVTSAQFADHFAATYAKDMAWRNNKGGLSQTEFNRIAAEHGGSLTEEQLKQAFIESKLQDIWRLSGEALTEFEALTTLPLAEWKSYEARMAVLADDFHPPAYARYLAEVFSLTDEAREKCRQAADAGAKPPELLALVGTQLDGELERLGEVEKPMKLSIHAAKPSEAESAR
ncbi:MAG: hypothetical protein NTV51_28100 [Verrucomicrobia bacterium]|nr:hypothetical protein [Verrucomicrobiota bacterium]